MALNFGLLIVTELIGGLVILILALFTYTTPKTKKIKSLFYIRLSLIIGSISYFFSGFSFLFVNIILSEISAILLFPSAVFLIIGINYSMKDSFFSISLIPVFCLGTLLCYLALQYDMVTLTSSNGFQIISWSGLFGMITYLILLVWVLYIFYWGLKTWMNAPFIIKKEASIFFFGTTISFWATLIVGSLEIWFPRLALWFIIAADILSITAILFFLISIMKEPKLLYILPFTINRILVKDKEGQPLFDHDWAESDISELMFTGFINAVQVMSEEVMNIGGLVDINLEKGILILRESELITVGLVASKSSRLLRETLINFTADFEQKFERELKKSIKDMDVYESAYLLLDKYFSNFSFKLIPSKKHPLALSGKHAKIPLELDNKLKDIFGDEKEYEFIKSELLKSPTCVPEEFVDLYNELKDEEDKISQEDIKDLEYNDK